MESMESVSDSYFKGGPSASDGVKRVVKRTVGCQGVGSGELRQGGNETHCLYGDPTRDLLSPPCAHSRLSPWLGCELKGRSYVLFTIASPTPSQKTPGDSFLK